MRRAGEERSREAAEPCVLIQVWGDVVLSYCSPPPLSRAVGRARTTDAGNDTGALAKCLRVAALDDWIREE